MEIDGVDVRFGNNDSTLANEVVLLGQHPMLIVDSIASNLISPFAMLDKGATMTLRPSDGDITNADGTSTIPLVRSSLKPVFTAQLSDVATFTHTPIPLFYSYPSGKPIPPDPESLYIGNRAFSTTTSAHSSSPTTKRLPTKAEVHRKLLRDHSLLFTVREPSLAVLQLLLRRRRRLLTARELSVPVTDALDHPTPVFVNSLTENCPSPDVKRKLIDDSGDSSGPSVFVPTVIPIHERKAVNPNATGQSSDDPTEKSIHERKAVNPNATGRFYALPTGEPTSREDAINDPLFSSPPRTHLPAVYCCDINLAKVTGDGVNARYALLHINSGHQPYKAIVRVFLQKYNIKRD